MRNHHAARALGRLAIALAIVAAAGCATSRKSGFEQLEIGTGHLTELKSAEDRNLLAEAKGLWKQRHERAALEQALMKLETLERRNPGVYEILVLLCRGNYLLADGHTDDPEKKKAVWERGAAWGEKAMAVNTAFYQKVVKEKTAVEDALDVLTSGEIEALYWTAVNLGKWAKISGITATLKYKGRVKKMIERVEQLDPGFFYGAVYRYWGVYYAVAPFFAGGSLEKSQQHFEKSLALANDYLATHVLYAENLATRKDDRELFRRELEFVLGADPNRLPDVMPEQLIEKRKAKAMLERMEDYF